MKVDVFNKKNEKIEMMDLSDKIFGVKWSADLAHQALNIQMANRREILAHTKGRGEVRGGGKKPWKQKGTGRARHGSIRSPLWPGGGVTFGPVKEKIFARKINKRMKQLAIFSVLSRRLKDNELKVIDSFDMKEDGGKKTKSMVKFLKVFFEKPSVLLIASLENKFINKSISNIKSAGAISSQSLNIYDLLKYKNIVVEKQAINEIEKHYNK